MNLFNSIVQSGTRAPKIVSSEVRTMPVRQLLRNALYFAQEHQDVAFLPLSILTKSVQSALKPIETDFDLIVHPVLF